MIEIKNLLSKIKSEEIILFVTLILSGGFNEFISCVISVVTSVFLIIKIVKTHLFCININVVSISVFAIGGGYFLSTFYAVDSGMAFIGFLKFLPIILYMILMMQNSCNRRYTIKILPYFALTLGIISFICMFIPVVRNYFVVAERFAGFFQYPNTFAMFLLVGELVALHKDKVRIADIVIAVLLFVLILYTGSRTVFVLALISNIVMLFLKKSMKVKIILIAIVLAFFALMFLLYPLLKDNEFFGRFFALSINESTFAGRLLYFYDALPVILKNPFGLGYMGYYYIQQSIQTGVYSVRYIHNDFLQLMLDVGWLPSVLFIVGIIKSIFGKANTMPQKIILVTIVLHSLFDFDLQFTAMFFILLLFMDFDSDKRVALKVSRGVAVFGSAFLGVLSLYFAVALSLSYFNNYKVSDAMYPFNTQNKVSVMVAQDSIEEQSKIADSIIEQNEYVQIAYSANARYAYSKGDFESLISNKNKIFQIAPFSYEEYEEYCYMLIQGIYMYEQIGDENSADYCRQELINTKQCLAGLEDRLSDLGRMIDDQPKTDLPDDIMKYISSLEVTK